VAGALTDVPSGSHQLKSPFGRKKKWERAGRLGPPASFLPRIADIHRALTVGGWGFVFHWRLCPCRRPLYNRWRGTCRAWGERGQRRPRFYLRLSRSWISACDTRGAEQSSEYRLTRHSGPSGAFS